MQIGLIIIVGIICIITASAAGYFLGRSLNRPTAPDLDGLIEQVKSYPDPEKAVYMIVRKVLYGKHLHSNPKPKKAQLPLEMVPINQEKCSVCGVEGGRCAC